MRDAHLAYKFRGIIKFGKINLFVFSIENKIRSFANDGMEKND
jgi:hypothetical protein